MSPPVSVHFVLLGKTRETMLKVLVLFTLVAHVNAVGRTGRCSEGCDGEAMYYGKILNCGEITQPDVDEEEHCQQPDSTKHSIEHVTSRSIHNTTVAHVRASGCKFLKRSTLIIRLKNVTAPSTLRSTKVANQLTLSATNNSSSITRLQRLFDGFQSLASLAQFRNKIVLTRLRTFSKSYDLTDLLSVEKTASMRVLAFLEPPWLNRCIDGSDSSFVRVEVYAKLISNYSNELQFFFRCRIQTPFICLYLETSKITHISDFLHRSNASGVATFLPLFTIQSAYQLTNERRMKRHRLSQLPMTTASAVVTKLSEFRWRRRPRFFNASVDVSDVGQWIGIDDPARNLGLGAPKFRFLSLRRRSTLDNSPTFKNIFEAWPFLLQDLEDLADDTGYRRRNEKDIMLGTVFGNRRQGRQKKQWMDDITQWSNQSLVEIVRMAENRETYRRYVHEVAYSRPSGTANSDNLSGCNRTYAGHGELKNESLYELANCRGNFIHSLSKKACTANLSGTRRPNDERTMSPASTPDVADSYLHADSCGTLLATTLYSAASIAVVVSLVALTGILIYKLRVKFYIRWKFHPFDCDECVGEDMDYDVFLCCSSEDHNPHGLRILNEIESKGYRVCYHLRDFLAGAPITDNMIQAIERSKRTVCLLSENFLRSSFCMTEFDMAYYHNVAVKRKKRLIVLMMLNSPTDLYANNASDTATLRHYLRQYTYIDYTADDWLEKLLYALPLRGLLQQNEDPLVEIVQLP